MTVQAAARSVLASIALLALAFSGAARAAPEREAEERADAALARFAGAYRDAGPAARAEAIRALAACDHERVAARLLEILSIEEDSFVLRAEVLRGLGRQRGTARRIAARVVRILEDEIRFKRKGILPLEVDPATGDLVTDTPEARACLRRLVERDGMREAAVRCLLRLETWRGLRLDVLTSFLESGHDGLVTAVLETIARRKDWRALPRVLDLYEIYPSERRWSMEHVRCLAFDDGKAKLAFLRRFGDPELHRPRPAVVEQIRRTLRDVTGETFEAPDALREYLGQRSVRQRMRRAPRD